MPNVHAGTCTELDSFGHPRRAVPSSNGITTSVYDITEPFNTHQHHQHYEQDLHHPTQPIQHLEFNNPQQRRSELNQPHLYESLHPHAPTHQVDGHCASASVNEPTHPRANFSRQVSAPSPAKRRYRRVSLPPESYGQSGNFLSDMQNTNSTQSSTYTQPAFNSHQFAQPSLHDNDPPPATETGLTLPSTFAPPDTHPQPQQQVQVVQPFRQAPLHMHRSLSEQSAMGPHPQSMEVAVKPLPRPRNLAMPTDQMMPVQPLPLSIQPLPLPGSVVPMTTLSQQHNTQQFTTTQQLTTFPGQTQVQTYSFAQHASVVTIPGIMPMSAGSPTIVNISPTFSSGQMSVQLVAQEPSIKPLLDQQQNSLSAASRQRSDGETSSPNETSSGGVLQVPGSSPDLNTRPVPKPRKVKKQSSDAELLAGNESGLEAPGSDGGPNGGSDVEDYLEQPELTEPATEG